MGQIRLRARCAGRGRPAIAMIELIFAITVIGIVLMSVPNLIQTAAKSGYAAIQQEAINEAASHLNMVLGYPWDENDADERYIDPLLAVTAGDTELDEFNNTGRRQGTPLVSDRSFVRADGARLSASAISNDGGETGGNEDDLDDFDGQTYNLTVIQTPVNPWEDYVEKEDNISISTTVTYAGDSPGSGTYGGSQTIRFDDPSSFGGTGTTNIKLVSVTLTSNSGIPELEKNITFRAFSCNIGAVELEERSF